MFFQTRRGRIFSPFETPGYILGMISVCSGFDLKSSMQRADREAELVKDDDEAEAPPETHQGDPSMVSDPPPDMSPPPTTAYVLNAVRYIISMCRSADPAFDSDPSTAASSLDTLPALQPVCSAETPSEPSATGPPTPHASNIETSDLPATVTTGRSGLESDSATTRNAPALAKNKRRIQRRKRKRDGVWVIKEKTQRHPSTREALAFPERLVEKYGTVEVKNTVKMNWFSVTSLLHAVGAFIGLKVLNVVKVAGWTAEQLLESEGFVLVQWDGR